MLIFRTEAELKSWQGWFLKTKITIHFCGIHSYPRACLTSPVHSGKQVYRRQSMQLVIWQQSHTLGRGKKSGFPFQDFRSETNSDWDGCLSENRLFLNHHSIYFPSSSLAPLLVPRISKTPLSGPFQITRSLWTLFWFALPLFLVISFPCRTCEPMRTLSKIAGQLPTGLQLDWNLPFHPWLPGVMTDKEMA